jgi:hypothetical protein
MTFWRRYAVPALATAVLVAGAAAYLVLFPEPAGRVVLPVAAAVPDAAVEAVPAFAVRDVTGVVEAGRGTAWRRLASGARLFAGESIRSGDDGRAVLESPGGDELELRERVTLEVTLLSRTLTELTLTQGKLRAATAANTERFAVSAGSARAVAPGSTRFTVYADERGAAYVATGSGAVQVAAAGRAVVVAAGAQTFVEPGRAPKDPFPVPAEVFLAVAWPAREQRQSRATVEGRTLPGTIVEVNGVRQRVAPDGSFAAPVVLREGPNPLEVRAEDLEGREKTLRESVNARTVGPPLEADPSKIYDPPPEKQP